MKIFFNTKIIQRITLAGLLLAMTFSSFIFFPRKAEAILGVGDIVTDPGNTVQSTITAGNTTQSAFSQYSLQFKEFVLDGLANAFAKQIIRQITASIVTWINSGFEGSPSFLQNPGSFFLDVADQATGAFISKNGILSSLCSPFSIDIRLALALKYRPNVLKRYACTLTTVITNSANAVKNASINGFTAGDFRQGGWPSFVSLTTEPQNNIYGAYIQAESDLSWRVASANATKRDEINNGQGFLSWRDPKCKADVKAWNTKIESTDGVNVDGYDAGIEGVSTLQPKSENDCPIQTPGSVISSTLQNNLGSPLRQLELADEFNEIVNALFAQLTTQVLQKGLAAVSSKDSNGSSYLDQTVADINNQSNPQVQSLRADLLKNTDTYKQTTITYKQNRDAALNLMLDAKGSFDAVKACYTTKIAATPQLHSSSQIQYAQNQIASIDSIIKARITDKAMNLLTLAQEADARLKTIQDIEDKANAAKTLNDLNGPSQEYGQLLQNRSLTTAADVQKSKDDLDSLQSDVDDIKHDASRQMQMCQLF